MSAELSLPELDVRSFGVLAYADEIVETPALLQAYARAFSASDDATLLICGPERTPAPIAERIGPALAAAGLAGDGGPDLLVVPLGGDPRADAFVRRCAHAVLTDREGPADPPQFGCEAADGLEALAQRRWEQRDRVFWDAEPPHEGVVNRSPAGHFYSPIPDTPEIAAQPRRSQVWPAQPRVPAGIDWREDEQARLCHEVFARQERLSFRDSESLDPSEYFTSNDQFPALDAWILEGLLREMRPRRMIEVGSGFSSLVTARVNREYLDRGLRFTCIEPFPRPFLVAGVDGISDLVVSKIQDAPLELFDELGEGDILFIDTSHTVKTGGDVTWLFHEVVPRLRPGVTVHVHDVFFPRDYPTKWVMEGWGWNEQYLVQSFLAFNSAFQVLLGSQWLAQRLPEAMVAAFPLMAELRYAERLGASLWFRRTGR